jgi:transposase
MLKQQMAKLDAIEVQLQATPDKQISLTNPDARSMATIGRGTGNGLQRADSGRHETPSESV